MEIIISTSKVVEIIQVNVPKETGTAPLIPDKLKLFCAPHHFCRTDVLPLFLVEKQILILKVSLYPSCVFFINMLVFTITAHVSSLHRRFMFEWRARGKTRPAQWVIYRTPLRGGHRELLMACSFTSLNSVHFRGRHLLNVLPRPRVPAVR